MSQCSGTRQARQTQLNRGALNRGLSPPLPPALWYSEVCHTITTCLILLFHGYISTGMVYGAAISSNNESGTSARLTSGERLLFLGTKIESRPPQPSRNFAGG